MKNKNSYVNRYCVCWKPVGTLPYDWKHKDFAQKKEAKQFAKKMKEQKPFPYIFKDVVCRSYFREDVEVEIVNAEPCDWGYMSPKIIRY